jgi:Membrane protein implicated in regulation of membrane protease activity
VVVFFVVSIAALIATRPLVSRMARKDTVATNADRVLGQLARVTEDIDNTVPTGAVYIDGKTWSARSADESLIRAGQMVRVVRMEGVRLFVEPTETK